MRYVLLLLLVPLGLQAQLRRTMNQTFDIADTIKTIQVIFPEADSLEVIAWPSANGMLEVNLEWSEANEALLKFAIEKERYTLEAKPEGTQLHLAYKNLKRPLLETRMGTIGEVIRLRLYLPEEFLLVKTGLYQR